MISSILGFLFIVFVILIARPITTLFHELGHAIPALVFTKEAVIIYIGSYGDTDKSIALQIGRLTILFRYKITDWQLGLCWHARTHRTIHDIIIVLGGPVFSLILGLIAFLMIYNFQDRPYMLFMLATILTSGLLDFIVNLIPNDQPLEMHNGNLVLNDGKQLQLLIKQINYPPIYFEALDLLEKGKKEEGIEKLKLTIDDGINDMALYRLIISLLAEEPEKAILFNDEYYKRFRLESSDFKLIGDLYNQTNEPSFSIECYSQAIRLNYKNKSALIERAKRYMDVELEQKAMDDLKVAWLIDEDIEVKKLMDQLSA